MLYLLYTTYNGTHIINKIHFLTYLSIELLHCYVCLLVHFVTYGCVCLCTLLHTAVSACALCYIQLCPLVYFVTYSCVCLCTLCFLVCLGAEYTLHL